MITLNQISETNSFILNDAIDVAKLLCGPNVSGHLDFSHYVRRHQDEAITARAKCHLRTFCATLRDELVYANLIILSEAVPLLKMLRAVTVKVEEACRVLLSWMICIAQEIQIVGVCLLYVVYLILGVHVSVDVEFSSCAL
jgi:hypothetical protein